MGGLGMRLKLYSARLLILKGERVPLTFFTAPLPDVCGVLNTQLELEAEPTERFEL